MAEFNSCISALPGPKTEEPNTPTRRDTKHPRSKSVGGAGLPPNVTNNFNDAMVIKERMTPQQSELVRLINNRTLDLIGDTQFDLVQKLFNDLDTDHNGRLDANDFTDQYLLKDNLCKRIWQDLSNRCDFDGDGSIDKGEFIAYFIIQALNKCAWGTEVEKDEAGEFDMFQALNIVRMRFQEEFNLIVMNERNAIAAAVREVNSRLAGAVK